MRERPILPWALAGLTVVVLAFGLVLTALSDGRGDGAVQIVAWMLVTLTSSGVGFVLATRRPGNLIGLLLQANALTLAIVGAADAYATYTILADPGALPGGEWALVVTDRTWPLLFAWITAVAFVFPDGRLPSPRWRPFAITVGVAFAVLALTVLFESAPFTGAFASIENPVPTLHDALTDVLVTLSGLVALAGVIGAAVTVRRRLKRSTGVERLQLRWLAFAAALIPTSVVVCLAEIAITGDDGPATMAAFLITALAIPLAIGVAVMRYRLYEIDRLVNRTLVYALLTATLAATYAAVALVLGTGLGGSSVSTAAATLAVALLFGPARQRAQLVVDRRFDRARYEALRKVEEFLADLRAGRAAPESVGDVLADALADPTLTVAFWLPDPGHHVDAVGRVITVPRAPGRAVTPIRRGEALLADVAHDEILTEHPDVLDSTLGAAGLAIEIARLRVEVRRRLAEVEDSRARIVLASYEERRRLERDLHDGAQQRLVSIGLALRHVQARLPGGAAERDELDDVVSEVTQAIGELRELARGVRPAGLDDGLATALRGLAARSALRIRVSASDERFDERVETAAYFVASEALANAAKHSKASGVKLSAGRRNGSLVLSVSDDGVGGARVTDGSGLAGLTDRVAALGGRLAIDSPPGAGTTVTVELPCAS